RAKSILKEHEDKLHIMAKALMKYETLNDVQVKDIMEDREVRPPKDWDDSDDSATTGAKEDTKGETTGVIGGPASEH
ncbi:MAG: ATP-dependent metalloprotease, partial [Woeseiaceae bacterium]